MHKKLMTFLLSLGASSCLTAGWQPSPTQLTPSIALGAENQAVAYSNAGDGLTAAVVNGNYISFTYNGTTWGLLTVLGSGTNTISLAMDSTGDGLAVYGTTTGISASRYQFSTQSWFNTGASGVLLYATADNPQVAMSNQGNGLAVYATSTSTEVLASQYDGATQTWSDTQGAAVQLSLTGSTVGLPSVAMDANSNGLAIWPNETSHIIQAANYNGTLKTWTNIQGSAINLSSNNISTGKNGQVAMSSNGTGLAVWFANPGSGNVVQSAWYNGASWQFTGGSALTLSAIGAITTIPLSIAMDANGNGIATWVQTGEVIQAAYFNGATQTWGIPVDISSTASAVNTPSVAFANNGNAFAAWTLFNGTETVVQSAYYNSSLGMWQNTGVNANTISDATESVSSVVIAANSQGKAIASFQEGVYPQAALFVNVFTPATLPQPDNGSNFIGRSGNDKFLSQIDHVHFLSWNASITPGVVGYLVQANGVVIANVLATEPLSLVLNNQQSNVAVTYTLTSYDSLGTQSAPLTITLN